MRLHISIQIVSCGGLSLKGGAEWPLSWQRSTANELNGLPQTSALSGGPADGGPSNLISGGVTGYILWRAAEVPVQVPVHGGGRSR